MTTKNYKTQDLYEAAALYSKKEKMVGIETDRKPYTFVFENFEVCKSLSLEYINNELAVLAKDYADAVKLLKSRVNTL
jgi:ribosomal protein L25 (general stress protein Ctc)